MIQDLAAQGYTFDPSPRLPPRAQRMSAPMKNQVSSVKIKLEAEFKGELHDEKLVD